MTTEEWLAAVAADRPPMTPDQKAVLHPICRRMAQNAEAAPASTREPQPDNTITERSAS